MQDFHRAIAQFTGQRSIIVIPRPLIAVAGGYEEAALLGQVVFWQDRMGGAFYKTLADFCEELAMSLQTLRRCRDRLESKGLVVTETRKVGATPKLHWSVVMAALEAELMRTMPPAGTSKSDLLEPASPGLVENNKSDLLKSASVHIQNLTKTEAHTEAEAGRDAARDAIDYLNLKTGRKFKPTESTLRHPMARIREGFSKGDLCRVVDAMVTKWGPDPKMSMYLRPETLFGTKMQSYLMAAQDMGRKRRDVSAERPVAAPEAGGLL